MNGRICCLAHGSLPAVRRRAYDSRVPLVWVIDPERRSVRVITVDAPVRWLREGETLDGGSTIPGFACPVSDLFVGLD